VDGVGRDGRDRPSHDCAQVGDVGERHGRGGRDGGFHRGPHVGVLDLQIVLAVREGRESREGGEGRHAVSGEVRAPARARAAALNACPARPVSGGFSTLAVPALPPEVSAGARRCGLEVGGLQAARPARRGGRRKEEAGAFACLGLSPFGSPVHQRHVRKALEGLSDGDAALAAADDDDTGEGGHVVRG